MTHEQQRRPDEERPLGPRRSGQLAHDQERHGEEQPALGAAGERERDAEERPVEDDERVRELGRAACGRRATEQTPMRAPARAGAAAAR